MQIDNTQSGSGTLVKHCLKAISATDCLCSETGALIDIYQAKFEMQSCDCVHGSEVLKGKKRNWLTHASSAGDSYSPLYSSLSRNQAESPGSHVAADSKGHCKFDHCHQSSHSLETLLYEVRPNPFLFTTIFVKLAGHDKFDRPHFCQLKCKHTTEDVLQRRLP